ncbi:MAG: FCD domain-containing protein, partial [Firmicutes bacterium]|nr:FCD domain-containing protein [Bacillota bacterium]
NSVLKRMLETVSELIRSQQGVVSQTLDLRKLTLEFHREIARALRGQDPLAAEAAMETHLLETQRVLQSG